MITNNEKMMKTKITSTVDYSFFIKSKIVYSFSSSNYRVLDIGCGKGKHISLYKNAVGIDFNKENLKIAKLKSSNNFICADALYLPFKEESFDCILIMEVIEHLTNPYRSLEEIRRILEVKGRLILTTPNRGTTKGIYKHKDHVREYTFSELGTIMEYYKFKIIEYTGSTIPFFPIGWRRLYRMNFNSFFFFLWKKLNKVFNRKWDMIILAIKNFQD